ncbi:hypothetical protein DFAR_2330006 [Desulfarculales bacterium]
MSASPQQNSSDQMRKEESIQDNQRTFVTLIQKTTPAKNIFETEKWAVARVITRRQGELAKLT